MISKEVSPIGMMDFAGGQGASIFCKEMREGNAGNAGTDGSDPISWLGPVRRGRSPGVTFYFNYACVVTP